MSLPRFTYVAPKSLKEACALLAEHGDKARLMAGGTDLLIRLRHRAMTPDYLVGMRGIPGLDQVRYDPENGLTIPALARLSDVADHPDVLRHYPALAQSAGVTATVQIRNMGTVVGNICNAAPSADNAPPLLVYGAEVVVVHPGGERVIPIGEFFRGPGLTALEPGEIVREIRVPLPGRRTGADYQKLSARSKVDIAAVGAASLIELDSDGVCVRARLALGAVAPVPVPVRAADKILTGRPPTSDLFEQVGNLAVEEVSPITDVRASAAYRRQMVSVLTVRSLQNSFNQAVQDAAGCER